MTRKDLNASNLVEADYEAGVFVNKWSKTRVFVLGSASWVQLRSDLEARYMEAGWDVLKQLGISFGHSLGHLALGSGIERGEIFETFDLLSRGGGWGKVSMVSGTPSDEEWTIRVEDCVFCSRMGKKPKPACEFLAGVFEGFATIANGKQYLVEEQECVAIGDKSCVFEVRLHNDF